MAVIYDSNATQKATLEVLSGDETFEVTHCFKPISDERWLQFLREQKIKGTGDQIETQSHEAVESLWRDQIVEVTNTETQGGDLADLVPFSEKKQALDHITAVAVKTAQKSGTSGIRVLTPEQTVTLETECFVDGHIATQTHELRKKTLEDIKRYESTLRRRFRQETIGGLRRAPKVEFVPQDHAFAKIYDDLCTAQAGYANGCPIWHKVAVVHDYFEREVDEKK